MEYTKQLLSDCYLLIKKESFEKMEAVEATENSWEKMEAVEAMEKNRKNGGSGSNGKKRQKAISRDAPGCAGHLKIANSSENM